jgi:hypothetical protein
VFQTNDVGNIKTHSLCSITFFFENRVAYEMWKTIVQATDASIIWRMRFTCCVFKVANTHSQYVILIAFPLQKWLHGRASILRCTYIDFLGFAPKIHNEKALALLQELSRNFILGTYI